MRIDCKAFKALLVATALTAVLPVKSAFADYHYKRLYSFKGGDDGSLPYARLIIDDAGNLYGTTIYGGPQGDCYHEIGCGTVFKLTPDGTETVLHAFCSQTKCADGDTPYADLIHDGSGNLYGTTDDGGAYGLGTVFRIAPNGTETVLHSFANGSAGGTQPSAGVVADPHGNLYGTTWSGGDPHTSAGVVFRLAPDGTFDVLADFPGGAGGGNPQGDLIIDKKGTLYGTLTAGGAANCIYGNYCGAVFKLRLGSHTIKIVHGFQGPPDDAGFPFAGAIMDQAGNLYGTTTQGGAYDRGATYEIAKDGTESVLHSFDRKTAPYGTLLRDKAGNLYGTASAGGPSDCGAVFKLMPNGQQIVLHAFDRVIDGCNSMAGLVADSKGYLYGTTAAGGSYGNGTVFRVRMY